MNQYNVTDLLLYQEVLLKLKEELTDNASVAELIKLQLRALKHIPNKFVRFMFLNDISRFFEDEQAKLGEIEKDESIEFNVVQNKIRSNPSDDHTVSFMLCGFIDELPSITSDALKNEIFSHSRKLIFTMRKFTGMHFQTKANKI